MTVIDCSAELFEDGIGMKQSDVIEEVERRAETSLLYTGHISSDADEFRVCTRCCWTSK